MTKKELWKGNVLESCTENGARIVDVEYSRAKKLKEERFYFLVVSNKFQKTIFIIK